MIPDFIDLLHMLLNGTGVRPVSVNRTRTADILFEAHSAPLDVQFYTGEQFPVRYRNSVFAAFNGSNVIS